MTNKIEYINDYLNNANLFYKSTMLSALIACLDPKETCSLLDLEFNQEFRVRRTILNKIGKDIKKEIQQCHRELISNLFESYTKVPYRKIQSLAYSLGLLYEFLPEEIQKNIVVFFLQSHYIGVRRKGYKIIREYKKTYRHLIEENWNKYHDIESAHIIINNFPISYLETNFEKLQKAVIGTSSLAKLYINVSLKDPNCIEQLRYIDEITYAYVLVKTNNLMDEELAFTIFEKQKQNKRIGLLLWCFGQMKLWSVLKIICDQNEK